MPFYQLNNLPPVLHEDSLKCFKFLMDGELHDGLQYNNELFYRIYKANADDRNKLYQYALQLSLREAIVITISKSSSSLWISLRSSKAALHLRRRIVRSPQVLSPQAKAVPQAIVEMVAK